MVVSKTQAHCCIASTKMQLLPELTTRKHIELYTIKDVLAHMSLHFVFLSKTDKQKNQCPKRLKHLGSRGNLWKFDNK